MTRVQVNPNIASATNPAAAQPAPTPSVNTPSEGGWWCWVVANKKTIALALASFIGLIVLNSVFGASDKVKWRGTADLAYVGLVIIAYATDASSKRLEMFLVAVVFVVLLFSVLDMKPEDTRTKVKQGVKNSANFIIEKATRTEPRRKTVQSQVVKFEPGQEVTTNLVIEPGDSIKYSEVTAPFSCTKEKTPSDIIGLTGDVRSVVNYGGLHIWGLEKAGQVKIEVISPAR